MATERNPEPSSEAPELPTKVGKLEALELENVTLKIRVAQQAEDAARGERERCTLERDRLVAAVAAKYQMDPERDSFNTVTLIITRAAPPPSTK